MIIKIHDSISSLTYPVIIHTPLVAGNLIVYVAVKFLLLGIS